LVIAAGVAAGARVAADTGTSPEVLSASKLSLLKLGVLIVLRSLLFFLAFSLLFLSFRPQIRAENPIRALRADQSRTDKCLKQR